MSGDLDMEPRDDERHAAWCGGGHEGRCRRGRLYGTEKPAELDGRVNHPRHASEVTANHCEVLDGWKCRPIETRPAERLLELWVPKAGEWLNSNDRRHRMAQAKITKAWREAAATVAEGLPTFEQPVRIVAQVWKSRLGDYDAGNLYPTAKACVDGYRDAGLLIEDNNRYVIGPDMRHGGKGEPGLYFLITELLEITVPIG